jgi:NAD(P)H-flavin reductase
MKQHPGGSHLLMKYIGLDATHYFQVNSFSKSGSLKAAYSKQIHKDTDSLMSNKKIEFETGVSFHNHSRYARYLLASMSVGKLRKEDLNDPSLSRNKLEVTAGAEESESKKEVGTSIKTDLEKAPSSLTPQRLPISADRFRNFIINSKKVVLTPDAEKPVIIYRIMFESSENLRIRPGESIQFQYIAEDNGNVINRYYTPLSLDNNGYVEFAIKSYEGQMTKHLKSARSIRMRGPILTNEVLCPFTENGCWKTLGMIAGGTGLSPMILLINYHLKYCKRDEITNKPLIQMHLLISNTSDNGIFFAKEIEKLEQLAMGALTVTYLVQKVSSAGYHGMFGNISEEIIAATMPKPEIDAGLRRIGISFGTSSLLRNRSHHHVETDDRNLMASSQQLKTESNYPFFYAPNNSHDEKGNMVIVVCGPTAMNLHVVEILNRLGHCNIIKM